MLPAIQFCISLDTSSSNRVPLHTVYVETANSGMSNSGPTACFCFRPPLVLLQSPSDVPKLFQGRKFDISEKKIESKKSKNVGVKTAEAKQTF